MAKYTSQPFGVKDRNDLKRPDKDQFATTYDILSEGPIEGLANGLSSIFINDIPLIQEQAENILKPRRFRANVTASTATITNAEFGTIDALSFQNKTGLSLGARKIAIEKAGAKGTGIASATADSFTVTTSSSYFTATMLAHCRQREVPIYLRIAGAGPNGSELRTRVTKFTSVTEVEIADPIATTVSNVDIFFDHFCNLSSISGNVGTVSPVPVSTVSSANIQVGSPITTGLNLSNLFNFKDVEIGFRVGNHIQPLLSPSDSEGTSTLFTPNIQLEQSNLRDVIGTTGNLAANYNDELEEPSQSEGTSADTVLSAAAMGVTAASEVDEVHLTFAFPQSHAIKQVSGSKGASFVELQIFFEYSTDNGSTFTSELAFGPSNNDVLTRTGGRNGRNVNFVINGSTNIPNNGYIKPNPAQFTSFIEEFKIDTREFQPFDTYRIRVRRITDLNFKDKSYQHTNPCTLQSVDNIVKDKLYYPYTSYAKLGFNAKDFDSNVPVRSYLLKGRKVKVPTNYFTRDENNGAATYTRNVSSGAVESTYQTWDGNFRGDTTTFNASSVNFDEVYTDNPVWIFYDLLTNTNYGLGQFIDADQIDKYELFRLAKFCDEEVPNGEGGTEPRFTCNVYITQSTEATNLIKQLASVFRGMAIWMDGQITAISDRRQNPVYTFTKANVKDGVFSYEGTGEKTKVNQIKVTWNDPADNYKQAAEYVEDTQALISSATGKAPRLIRKELLAFGTTSRGQAHRLGKWKLLSEQTETETISFVTGPNAIGLKPGDIIAVQDADRDRASYSGRVSNYNPEAGLTLDATFDLINGGAIQIGGGNTTTFPGGYTYTPSQESDKILFAGEVTLPSSFSQDACMWEHGGEGTGAWLGVRDISGTYNLTLRSGEGSVGTQATSADGIVTNIPIADIPEFDDGVHTICWAFRPDATPGTHKLWIDGKLYINDETSSATMENNEWSGGGHGGWLKTTDARSGGLSANAWPTTEGASGLRHYFGEDAGASATGQTTTQVVLDRNVTIPAYSSSFPPQLLLIYPEGGAYLNQDSATISSVDYSKGDLIPSVTSSSAAANLIDDSNNHVDVYWSENARIESKTISSPGTSGGTTNTLTVSSAFTAIPSPEVMWSLRIFNTDGTEATGTVKEYKLINIKEAENQEFEIVGAEYNKNKFDLIERGYVIDPRPNDTFPNPEDEVPAPDSVTVKITPGEFADQDSSDKNFFTTHDANITWNYPENSDGSRYGFVSGFEVTHNFKGKFITERVETQTQGIVIENVKGGTYEVAVRTISSINTFSLENKRSFSFNQLHFTSPTVPSKEITLPKGGLITAPLSFVNGTFQAGDGSSTYQFTAPDGETETLSTSSTQTLTVQNNSGDPTTGHSFILLDLTSNTKQLRQLVQVNDTTASPTKSYFKLNGASNEGLFTVNGTIVIEQNSNKVTGTGTNFDGDYEDGMLVKIPNGSSTTRTTGASSSNSTTVTLSSSNSDIKVGQTVTGTFFGTDEATYTNLGGSTVKTGAGEVFVTAISGTTLTVSAPITVANGVTLTFTPRSFYSRIVEIASDTLMFLEDISPRKYSGVQPQRLAYEPNPLKDSIIARTFSKNGVYSFIDFTEFTVADGALTISKISADTIVTESDAITSNDNDTTIPTSAAVKDYVDNQSLTGYVDTTGTPADNQIAVFTDSNTLEGTSNLTYDGTSFQITNNSVSDSTLILNTSNGSNGAGPILDFNRDSSTPADADYLGQIKFRGENDADQDTIYAKITAKATDVTDGTEDGAIEFTVKKNGSNNINMRLSQNNLNLINGTGLEVAGNATISGNLTVDGTTTTINTADLNVEDKNIVLNYHASNDTSSTADGAGITIQDAVDASTDATILWDATNDEFDFSHKATAPALSTTGGIVSATANGVSQKHFTLIDSANTSIQAAIYHDNGIMSIESNNNTAAGQIVFKRRTSSTTVETARFDASGNFQFGASPTTILDPSRNLFGLESIGLADNKRLKIGSASFGDLSFIHDGTNTYMQNITGNLDISNTQDDGDILFKSDDGSGGITEYFRLDGSLTKTYFEQNVQFNDNVRLQLGAGADVQMFHNGSDSFIDNNTGHLYITCKADDHDIILGSDDGSGGTVAYLTIDGSAGQNRFNANALFFDNKKALFGDGADLEIYHTGTESIIADTGTGHLYIRGQNLLLQNADGSKAYLAGSGDVATLYYGTNAKLATTSLGIDVSGQIEFGDGHLLGNDGFDNFTLRSSSGENIVVSSANDVYVQTGGTGLSDTGNTRMIIKNSTGNVGIGSGTTPGSRLTVVGGGNYDQLRLAGTQTDSSTKYSGLSFEQYDTDEEGYLGLGGFSDSSENAVMIGGGTGAFNAATRLSFITAANAVTTTGTERMRIDSSGRVGIATTTPDKKLDVVGDGSFSGVDNLLYLQAAATGTPTLRFEQGTTRRAFIRYQNANSNFDIINEYGGVTIWTGTSGSESQKLIVDSSGNVGIGGATPNQRLVIADTTGETTLAINNATTTVGNRSRLDFRHNGITGSQIKSGAIEDFTTTANRTSDLRFFTRNNGTIAEAMRITEAGNIGVGLTSPQTNLHLHSSSNTQITFTDSGTGTGSADGFRVGWNGTYGQMYLFEDADMRFATNNAVRMTIKNDGKVGIGTASPFDLLDVAGSGNVGLRIRTSGGGLPQLKFHSAAGLESISSGVGSVRNMAFNVGDAERIRIKSDGNVGIGTTSPSEKLHVNGGSSDVALRVDTTNADPKIRLTTLGQQDWALGVDYSDSGKFKICESGTIGTLTALTIDASRNVGIGTETPAYKLDLGTASSTFRLVSANAGTAIRIGTGGGSSDVVLLRVDGQSANHDGETDSAAYGFSLKYFGVPSGNNNRFGLLADNQEGTQVEAFSILQDGKMGINNTNPTARLDVTGGIKASDDLAVDTDTLFVDVSTERVGINTSTPSRPLHVKDNDDVVAFFESTDSTAVIHIKDQTTGLSIGSDSSGNGVFGADIDQVGSKNILFKLAGSEKVRIDSSGNVLIGATSPKNTFAEKTLSVISSASNTQGMIEIGGNNTSDSFISGLSFTNEQSTDTSNFKRIAQIFAARDGNNSAGDLVFNVHDGSTLNRGMTIKSDGKIGIGTDSPNEILHVQDAATSNGTSLTLQNSFGESSKNIKFRNTDTVETARIEAYGRNNTSFPPYLAFHVNQTTSSSQSNDVAERMRIDSSGNVGIGTTSPTHGLTVVGSADSDASSYISINDPNNTALSRVLLGVGGDGDGQITLKEDGNSTTVFINSEGSSYFNGGNVGIGTTSPDTKLDVSAAGVHGIILNQDTSNSAVSSRLFFKDSTRTNAILNVNGNLELRTGAALGSSSGTKRLVVNGNGNVCIGDNTAPSRQLTVYNTSAAAVLAITTSTSNLAQIALGDTDDDNYAQILLNNSTNKLQIQNGGGGAVGERGITLDSSENVGIGISSPTHLLHLYKAVDSAQGILVENTGAGGGVSSSANLYLKHSTLTSRIYNYFGNLNLRTDSAHPIYLWTNGTQRLTVGSTGNVGIGTTNPSGKLHVYDSGTDTYGTQPIAIFDYYDTDDTALRYSARIGDGSTSFKTFVTSSATDFLIVDQDNTAGRLAFQVQGNAGNTEALAVDSTGKVGIGTTSPGAPLEIYGAESTMKFNSSAGRSTEINQGGGNFHIRTSHSTGVGINYGQSDAGLINLYNNTTAAVSLNANGTSYFNGGNIAIGTTSATSAMSSQRVLRMQGTGNNEIILDHTDGGTSSHIGILSFERNGDHLAHIMAQHDGATDSARIAFNTQATGGAFGSGLSSNERMCITSIGRVGIGTTNPATGLHVNTGATNSVATFESTDSLARIILKDNAGEVHLNGVGNNISLRTSNGGTERFKIDGSSGAITFNQAYTFPTADGSANQVLQTDGSGNLTFANAGGGTITSASNMVDNRVLTASGSTTINGEANLTFDGSTLNVTGGITATGTIKTDLIQREGDGLSGQTFIDFDMDTGGSAGTNNLVLGAVNNMDFIIDTNNNGTTGAFVFGTDAQNMSSATELMRLDESGRLGIGTNSPADKLDVYGTIRMQANGLSDKHLFLVDSSDTSKTSNIYFDNGLMSIESNNGNSAGSILFKGRTSSTTIEFARFDSAGNLGVGTASPSAKLQVENYGIDTTATSTTSTTQTTIHTFAAATFRSARYTIQVTNSTDSTYMISEILMVHDGTTPSITEYGVIFTGSAREAAFDADISSGNVRLRATPASTDTMTFKVVAHSIVT